MKKNNSAGEYEFIQGDLSLMKGVRSVAAEIAGKVQAVNFLCMSMGILSMESKDDTEEQIDKKMALHFYSRYLDLGIELICYCTGSSLQIFFCHRFRGQQINPKIQEFLLCWGQGKGEVLMSMIWDSKNVAA